MRTQRQLTIHLFHLSIQELTDGLRAVNSRDSFTWDRGRLLTVKELTFNTKKKWISVLHLFFPFPLSSFLKWERNERWLRERGRSVNESQVPSLSFLSPVGNWKRKGMDVLMDHHAISFSNPYSRSPSQFLSRIVNENWDGIREQIRYSFVLWLGEWSLPATTVKRPFPRIKEKGREWEIDLQELEIHSSSGSISNTSSRQEPIRIGIVAAGQETRIRNVKEMDNQRFLIRPFPIGYGLLVEKDAKRPAALSPIDGKNPENLSYLSSIPFQIGSRIPKREQMQRELSF